MNMEVWDFIKSKSSLILSTIDDKNIPHTSYAPFVESENRFYIFASAMAKHSKTILNSDVVSVMFIEDEHQSLNIFARKRVTFESKIRHISRDTLTFKGVIKLFYEKLGEDASIYEHLGDFQLFELTPLTGRAVFGFGKAYSFSDGKFGSKSIGM